MNIVALGKNMKIKNRITLIGTVVLGVGVGLLIFTFVTAYMFLTSDVTTLNAGDLGEALAASIIPLLVLCSRLMYLGVMGWVGSIISSRGIQLLLTATKEKSDTPKKNKT